MDENPIAFLGMTPDQLGDQISEMVNKQAAALDAVAKPGCAKAELRQVNDADTITALTSRIQEQADRMTRLERSLIDHDRQVAKLTGRLCEVDREADAMPGGIYWLPAHGRLAVDLSVALEVMQGANNAIEVMESYLERAGEEYGPEPGGDEQIAMCDNIDALRDTIHLYQAMGSRPAPSQPPQHAATYQWPVGSTDVLHAPTAGVRILPEPEWKDADGALEAVDALLAALHTSAEHYKLIDLLDQMQRIGRIDADTAGGLLDMVERQREQARQQILDGARKPEVEIVSQEPSDAERQVGSMRRLFAAAVRDLIRAIGTDGQGHAVAELVRLTQQHD